MSNLLVDDQSSRLKQFTWEELDENFFLAVIFRAGRRYVVQRYFEEQLVAIKSEARWRRCLFEVISKSLAPLYLTRNEVELMHEIFSWHLNSPHHHIRLREQIDYLIDFEDLIDCFHSKALDDTTSNAFLMQPVTTLDAARKNIEMWKNLQGNFLEQNTNQTVDKQVRRQTPSLTFSKLSPPSDRFSSTTGWLQLDSKIVPFIKKHRDRLLPVEYLLGEHVITSSEDFSLRSLYIPITLADIPSLTTLIRHSSSNFLVTNQTSLITLDHLIFRLKRLFFIRFLSSPINYDQLDYHEIMSCNGGLLTLANPIKQRIPFLYINKQKYIPEFNSSSISTFCMANRHELEYLRLVSLYDYLSSEENNDNLRKLSSIDNLTLIPIDFDSEQKLFTTMSLNDFHFHEYQRRTQQEKNLIVSDDHPPASTGWWQPPISSSKPKRPLSHFKLQRPIFF